MIPLLVLAFAIRLLVALSFWNVVAPDEIFQALEQAHRLVFGQSVVPWEFQVGLRCWLIPLLLAGPMALAHLLWPAPLAGLVLIRMLLCAASLPIVACAAAWGGRFGGTRGFWIAGLLAAFWPDLWLMAPHPLEEVLAADCLVPAVYLCTIATARRHVAVCALLLGFAFTLRLQLAPAIAIAGIWLCRWDARRWALAVTVAALPVLLAGVLDWAAWGQPFRSFWLNVWINLGLGVAAHQFGRGPALYFIGMLGLDWLWTLPVVLVLLWRGAKLLPLPALLAFVILLTHSLIAHKELRFIFPAIALAVPVAGIGLAALLRHIPLNAPRVALAALLLAGPLMSPLNWLLLRWQTGSFAIFRAVAAQHPALVSVQGWDKSFLPLDVLFDAHTILTSRTVTKSGAAGFVVASSRTGGPAGYRLVACRRPGWVPAHGSYSKSSDLCAWMGPAGPAPRVEPPPFVLPFPSAALPYVIRDRF